MKTLKITTHWSDEEADCVYRLLGEIQAAIWESYGKEIDQLYQAHREEQLQQQKEREQLSFQLDDIPF
jgi:hypothetical protein